MMGLSTFKNHVKFKGAMLPGEVVETQYNKERILRIERFKDIQWR